jgi:pyrroline-5-carboxylate reductase
MLNGLRFGFVGPGVMGEAMVSGLLERAGVLPEQIVMSGPRADRLAELAAGYGVGTVSESRAAVSTADVVVLSVKPQYWTALSVTCMGRCRRVHSSCR